MNQEATFSLELLSLWNPVWGQVFTRTDNPEISPFFSLKQAGKPVMQAQH